MSDEMQKSNDVEMISVPAKLLHQFIESDEYMNEYEAVGVDNWEGVDYLDHEAVSKRIATRFEQCKQGNFGCATSR